MVSPSKRTVQLVAAFIALANKYEANEWVAYLLWATLEGERPKPFFFYDPLTDEELETLRALRDEAGLWLFWQNNKWNPTAIATWREHARTTSAGDVVKQLEGVR